MTMGRRRREPEEWLVFHCSDDCCLSVAVPTPCTSAMVIIIMATFAMMLVEFVFLLMMLRMVEPGHSIADIPSKHAASSSGS